MANLHKTKVEKILKSHGQQKLLEQISNSHDHELANLSQQLEQVPWDEYPRKNQQTAQSIDANSFSPSKIISLNERTTKSDNINKLGTESYKNGEVAILMVAGGQGTRLGFSGPKGCYKIAPISGKSLYQIHSEKVLALGLRFGSQVPFLIMTSEATDAETKNFFKSNKFFGLAESQIEFFQQASIPSLDLDGNLLFTAPGKLLTSPDGHGGCFTALAKSGLLNELKDKGIKHLIYIQVDNILAPVFDPFLIGLAISERAEVITKVVEKCSPDEKVGLLVSIKTKKISANDDEKFVEQESDTIKEYIELPKELLSEKDSSGRLKYRAGNTAMHCWNINFLSEKYEQDYKLPLHASKKPLNVWQDGEVKVVEGYKFERFIFDLIPEAQRSLGLEIDRSIEFAPLKNSSGNDSPETVRQICSNLYRSWLSESGISLSQQIEVEVSPLLAMNSETLNNTLNFDKQLKESLLTRAEKKQPIYID